MSLATKKYLDHLKEECSKNNSEAIVSYFENYLNPLEIKIIKEQKLFLLFSDGDAQEKAIASFEYYLKTQLSASDCNQELNYLRFVRVISHLLRQHKNKLSNFLSNLGTLSQKQYIQVVSIFWETYSKDASNTLFEKMKPHFEAKLSNQQRAELNEWMMHMLNGVLLDVQFAIARSINSFSGNTLETKIEESEVVKYVHFIEEVIHVSAQINTFQFCIDKVSYGEWHVDEISNDGERYTLGFGIVDKLFDKARELALRRNISFQFLQKNQNRWLKQNLEEVAIGEVQKAIEYYRNNGVIIINNDDTREIMREVNFNMNLLDADDELLTGFDQTGRVFWYYVTALSLVCYQTVANYYRTKYIGFRGLDYYVPTIPLDQILKEAEIDEATQLEILNDFVSQVPSNNIYQLIVKPLIREPGGKYFSISIISSQNWVLNVRTCLVKGGKEGDRIGRAWEEFIAYTFENYGWAVIENGLKIGRELPDIDLLIYREGLLILAQVKAIYLNGINTYEQWKAKEKIIKGASQVQKVKVAIESNLTIYKRLESVMRQRKILKIYSAVITNNEMFNGWVCDGVPVVGVNGLMQIFRGVNVKFFDSRKRILETLSFTQNKAVNNDDFIKFLEKPLDWHLADIEDDLCFHVEKMDEIIINMPQLKRSDNLNVRDILRGN